jgi:hypothetical protein
VYVIVSRCRVGRKSFSVIADDRSRMSTVWRMMPRCSGVVSFNNLYPEVSIGTSGYIETALPSSLPSLLQSAQYTLNTPVRAFLQLPVA